MNKTALITGINGQDGSYLSEFLLNMGYTVHGILKRNSVSETQTSRLGSTYDKLILHYADMNDLSSLISVIISPICTPAVSPGDILPFSV